ncbi:hypothetical protein AVEN_105472-1 [Araneus ventricosus]|uniref:Uncharacterized protein n=1 Tax=Araneus ventricosus TaxID=182803 RepID=A0A4Y2GM76_ARAVE|nr:hypothetical protein AVEN_105472-1 [Araneus ventricosus]
MHLPVAEWFPRGRSTFDNLVLLETQIRNAFIRRNHLVSIFFSVTAYSYVNWVTWGHLGTTRDNFEFVACVFCVTAYSSVDYGDMETHVYTLGHIGICRLSLLRYVASFCLLGGYMDTWIHLWNIWNWYLASYCVTAYSC